MLNESNLSCYNYSQTLVDWAENPLTPDNLSLGAQEISYDTEAAEARNILLGKGWTIDDGGLDEDCSGVPTGISKNRTSVNVMDIYPNPNKGVFTINIVSDKSISGTVQVINMLGQIVESIAVSDKSENFNYSIDLSRYGRGVYQIQLTDNGQRLSRQAVVQ